MTVTQRYTIWWLHVTTRAFLLFVLSPVPQLDRVMQRDWGFLADLLRRMESSRRRHASRGGISCVPGGSYNRTPAWFGSFTVLRQGLAPSPIQHVQKSLTTEVSTFIS